MVPYDTHSKAEIHSNHTTSFLRRASQACHRSAHGADLRCERLLQRMERRDEIERPVRRGDLSICSVLHTERCKHPRSPMSRQERELFGERRTAVYIGGSWCFHPSQPGRRRRLPRPALGLRRRHSEAPARAAARRHTARRDRATLPASRCQPSQPRPRLRPAGSARLSALRAPDRPQPEVIRAGRCEDSRYFMRGLWSRTRQVAASRSIRGAQCARCICACSRPCT